MWDHKQRFSVCICVPIMAKTKKPLSEVICGFFCARAVNPELRPRIAGVCERAVCLPRLAKAAGRGAVERICQQHAHCLLVCLRQIVAVCCLGVRAEGGGGVAKPEGLEMRLLN